SRCGGNALKLSAPSCDADTMLTLENFPRNLKKGLSMTFSARFDAFSSLKFGKGIGSYRGDWFEIDETCIRWKHYEAEESERACVEHGMKIEKYLMAAFHVGDDGVCTLSCNTFGGTKSFSFDWCYEQNGKPFAVGSQNMTDVVLGAAANDIKSPMWLLGDSYFGTVSCRIIGQLQNLGYADGCLIDGLAGQNSAGAYFELESLLALGGVPRYLVWALGMNDPTERYETYLEKVITLSKKYGFELILQKIPVVPDRIEQNMGVNAAAAKSGLRFIDAYKAVGADDTGTWYDGYLYTDRVHPTDAGAAAIAARMLVDVPELMQFGYHPRKLRT
ncbi:MAG: SGNH/GDSL hydrolase family protein, partial [Clostridia bacterium]|nr:SGNH/GDSL hydrolase family protein [Clostridia bacterium]